MPILKLAVIIPVYNEEGKIGKVVKGIDRNLVDEVIVVNDGSTDNTKDEATESGAVTISHKVNKGIGGAVRTGIEYALQNNADILVIMAGDGQSDPEELERMVQPIITGNADFVLGSRLLGNYETMPLIRYIGNKIFTLIVNLLTRRNFTDVLSGYRALTKDLARKITIKTAGYGLESEMLIRAAAQDFVIKEIPIKTIYTKNTSKMIPFLSWAQIFVTEILTFLDITKNRLNKISNTQSDTMLKEK